MQSYVAGLDGGGTKTAVAVRFSDGSLCRAAFGPLNPSGNALSEVEQTLRQIFAFLTHLPGGLKGCQALCIGGAGVSNPMAESFFRRQLGETGFSGQVLLVGDHEAAFTGAFMGGDGIVLISGTGSICYGRVGNQTARCGGYGYLIDDEGSGYAIGREILSAVVHSLDGRTPPTLLTKLVFDRLSFHTLQDIISFVYHPDTGKAQIASLAVLLPDGIEANDPAAIAIADRCARQLAGLARTVISRLDLTCDPLALLGSILVHQHAVSDRTRNLLLTEFPAIRFAEPLGDASDGAALLALRPLEHSDDRR